MTGRRAQYLDLADELAARWAGLPPGSMVESEHQVAVEFGVNRLTARESFRELERRLLVRRVAGSGTFTAHRLGYHIAIGEPPSFRRIVEACGHAPGVRHLTSRWEGRGEARTLVLDRVLTIDGLDSSLASDRFPRAIGSRVEQRLMSGGSVVDALREVGNDPYRSGVRVALVVPDRDVAADLGYSASPPPVWRVESSTTDGCRGPVVHRSTSWMRPDMFELTVEVGSPSGD